PDIGIVALFFRRHFSIEQSKHIRKLFDVARPRSIAYPFDLHFGQGRKVAAYRRHNGRARRRDELAFDLGRIYGDAFEKFQSARRGDGKGAVAAIDESLSDVQRRAEEEFDSDRFESYAGSDDIDYCIYCSDFMEMNLFGRDPVHRAFG